MRVTSLKMDGNGNKCLDHSTLNAFLGRNEEIDHIKSNINKTQSKNAKIFIVTVFFSLFTSLLVVSEKRFSVVPSTWDFVIIMTAWRHLTKFAVWMWFLVCVILSSRWLSPKQAKTWKLSVCNACVRARAIERHGQQKCHVWMEHLVHTSMWRQMSARAYESTEQTKPAMIQCWTC